MRAWLWSLVVRYFNAELIDVEDRAIEVYKEHRKQIPEEELHYWLDKPIIVISNDLSNPVVGFAVGVEDICSNDDPVLVVFDYITNKEYLVFGVVFDYSDRVLDTILSIDPICLNYLLFKNRFILDKSRSDNLMTPKQIRGCLFDNGFDSILEEYKKNV